MNRYQSVIALAICASSAHASPIFLASHENQLFVHENGATQQFALSDNVTSMAVAPDGTIYASSPEVDVSSGLYTLYTIDNPTTAPALNPVGTFLNRKTPSLTFINGQLYGFQGGDGNTDVDLVTINIAGLSQSIVGATGLLGGISTAGIQGTGYDAATDTLFGLSRGNPNRLWDIDRTAAPDPTGAFIAEGIRVGNLGGEFFGGTLYQAWYNDVDDSLNLGSINTADASFSPISILGSGFGGEGSVGLAIIPAPGTYALAGLAGFIAIRRKR